MRTNGARLLVVAVLVGMALLTGAEVTANPTGVPVAQPGPRFCETTNFRIEAVPLEGEFPTTECVNNAGQPCVEYGYRVTSKASPRINKVIFAVPVDQDLDSTASNPTSVPAAVASVPGAGESTTLFLQRSRHEWTLRYTYPSSTTSIAEPLMRIVAPSAPRTTTVLIRAFSGVLESCLIAGPGVQSNPFQPVPKSQSVACAGGKCTCNLFFDSAGKIESVTTEPPCATSETDVTVTLETPTGPKTETATFFEVITSGFGTCTTYPTRPRATTICR